MAQTVATSLLPKEVATRRGLKKGSRGKHDHRNTVARHDGIAVVMSFARSSKAAEARNVRLLSTTRLPYRATAFRFKRFEPTCMNGTSVKKTLPFNEPSRTFAVADVQRKLALTSLFLAPCVLSMVDSTSQPPITPEYANCQHVELPARPLYKIPPTTLVLARK